MEKKYKKILLFSFLPFIIFIILNIGYREYSDYENSIVEQQQKHLLTIARSISRSLRISIREKVDSLKILKNGLLGKDVQKERYTRSLEEYYQVEKGSVDRVTLFDDSYKILAEYPKDKGNGYEEEVKLFRKELEYVYDKKNEYIGGAYRNTSGKFVVNIYEPIIDSNGGSVTGILTVSISLENIYKRLVEPVKAGKHGYALVKNKNGTILMHPAKENIGKDVVESRRTQFPELQYKELQELVKRHLAGEEGTAIYRSYWWPEEKLELVKKLNAFTPVYITDSDYWVVSVLMSYSEVKEVIADYIFNIILSGLVLIAIFSAITIIIFKIQKSKESYKLETKYLNQLNISAEKLWKREAELEHSRKLKTIGTLTSGVAHEFNNVLTPILGYSEMILNDLDKNDEVYEDVDEIYKASEKAKELINQILVYSKSEKTKLTLEVISLKHAVKDAVKLVKSFLPANIEVNESYNCKDVNVLANRTQIHQIILNLCTNAYHAMRGQEGTLSVNLGVVIKEEIKEHLPSSQENEGSHYAEISIKDTGCGMDKETIKNIFDPFFTTRLTAGGTGLGLSVIHGIVSEYMGAIAVESELNRGSTFKIYLPLSETIVFEENQVEKLELVTGKKVLLIDDNEQVIKVVKKGLIKHGHEVTAYTDSVEALRGFVQKPDTFDVVISDQTMPGMEGTQVSKNIRNIRKDIKILMITANVVENLKKFKEEGVINDYIEKPFTLKEILQHL